MRFTVKTFKLYRTFYTHFLCLMLLVTSIRGVEITEIEDDKEVATDHHTDHGTAAAEPESSHNDKTPTHQDSNVGDGSRFGAIVDTLNNMKKRKSENSKTTSPSEDDDAANHHETIDDDGDQNFLNQIQIGMPEEDELKHGEKMTVSESENHHQTVSETTAQGNDDYFLIDPTSTQEDPTNKKDDKKQDDQDDQNFLNEIQIGMPDEDEAKHGNEMSHVESESHHQIASEMTVASGNNNGDKTGDQTSGKKKKKKNKKNKNKNKTGNQVEEEDFLNEIKIGMPDEDEVKHGDDTTLVESEKKNDKTGDQVEDEDFLNEIKIGMPDEDEVKHGDDTALVESEKKNDKTGDQVEEEDFLNEIKIGMPDEDEVKHGDDMTHAESKKKKDKTGDQVEDEDFLNEIKIGMPDEDEVESKNHQKIASETTAHESVNDGTIDPASIEDYQKDEYEDKTDDIEMVQGQVDELAPGDNNTGAQTGGKKKKKKNKKKKKKDKAGNQVEDEDFLSEIKIGMPDEDGEKHGDDMTLVESENQQHETASETMTHGTTDDQKEEEEDFLKEIQIGMSNEEGKEKHGDTTDGVQDKNDHDDQGNIVAVQEDDDDKGPNENEEITVQGEDEKKHDEPDNNDYETHGDTAEGIQEESLNEETHNELDDKKQTDELNDKEQLGEPDDKEQQNEPDDKEQQNEPDDEEELNEPDDKKQSNEPDEQIETEGPTEDQTSEVTDIEIDDDAVPPTKARVFCTFRRDVKTMYQRVKAGFQGGVFCQALVYGTPFNLRGNVVNVPQRERKILENIHNYNDKNALLIAIVQCENNKAWLKALNNVEKQVTALTKFTEKYYIDGIQFKNLPTSKSDTETMSKIEKFFESVGKIQTRSKHNLQIGLTIDADAESIKESFESFSTLNKVLSWYSIHTISMAICSTSYLTGTSPLRGEVSLETTIKTLMSTDIDRNRVIIGIQLYPNKIGKPKAMEYSNMCSLKRPWTNWCYARPEHFRQKGEFVRTLEIWGVQLYYMSSDDYLGKCKCGQTFPMIRALLRGLMEVDDPEVCPYMESPKAKP